MTEDEEEDDDDDEEEEKEKRLPHVPRVGMLFLVDILFAFVDEDLALFFLGNVTTPCTTVNVHPLMR